MLVSLTVGAALVAFRGFRGRSQPTERERPDYVQVESDDSFPASDPPSHTPTTGASIDPGGSH